MKKYTILLKTLLIVLAALLPISIFSNKSGEIGSKAANFDLENIDGKMVSLSDYKSEQGLILIFTCNTCPYSVAYEDRINELHDKYSKLGYPVVAINPNSLEARPDDRLEKMKERAAEKGFKFAYLSDAKQEVFPKYGASRTPHIYVLSNKSGEFTIEYVGSIDDNYKDATKASKKYVEEVISDLMNNKEPRHRKTRAIGCTIKR